MAIFSLYCSCSRPSFSSIAISNVSLYALIFIFVALSSAGHRRDSYIRLSWELQRIWGLHVIIFISKMRLAKSFVALSMDGMSYSWLYDVAPSNIDVMTRTGFSSRETYVGLSAFNIFNILHNFRLRCLHSGDYIGPPYAPGEYANMDMEALCSHLKQWRRANGDHGVCWIRRKQRGLHLSWGKSRPRLSQTRYFSWSRISYS